MTNGTLLFVLYLVYFYTCSLEERKLINDLRCLAGLLGLVLLFNLPMCYIIFLITIDVSLRLSFSLILMFISMIPTSISLAIVAWFMFFKTPWQTKWLINTTLFSVISFIIYSFGYFSNNLFISHDNSNNHAGFYIICENDQCYSITLNIAWTIFCIGTYLNTLATILSVLYIRNKLSRYIIGSMFFNTLGTSALIIGLVYGLNFANKNWTYYLQIASVFLHIHGSLFYIN